MSVVNDHWTVERSYPQPPSVVFAAWADPAVKVRWFDLSDQPEPTYRSDFRVGGRESLSSPAGQQPVISYDAQYRDIVTDERIVSTYEMSVDGRRVSVSVATVEFQAEGTGTRLVYVEQGAYLDGLDSATSRRSGTTTQLDLLADLLDTRT